MLHLKRGECSHWGRYLLGLFLRRLFMSFSDMNGEELKVCCIESIRNQWLGEVGCIRITRRWFVLFLVLIFDKDV